MQVAERTQKNHPEKESSRPRLIQRLLQPVDIASLAFFRVAFGLLLFLEIFRYLALGWVQDYYIAPQFHFTYSGFDWVRPWPGQGMNLQFIALGILALMITVGFWYRVAVPLFVVGFTHVFLIDQAWYQNHFYLIILLGLILTVVPAHRAFSADATLRPHIRSETVPAWGLWLLRAQLAVVYVFGGIAKLNSDWLQGEPLRLWLRQSTDFPLVGGLFTQEWVVYLMAYGALLLDLLAVPLLLWRRTRAWALALIALFHVMNWGLFNIGVFPFLAIAATTVFLSPDWPRRMMAKLSFNRPRSRRPTVSTPQPGRVHPLVVGLIGLYLAVQVFVPLRHFLYPGEVSWTEEGYRFAWHMMLREKVVESRFLATDPASGRTWEVDPREYLVEQQAEEMALFPDGIHQLARYLGAQLEEGYPGVEVRARVSVSLNGREPQLIIDPNVDLAHEPETAPPHDWILPLTKPL